MQLLHSRSAPLFSHMQIVGFLMQRFKSYFGFQLSKRTINSISLFVGLFACFTHLDCYNEHDDDDDASADYDNNGHRCQPQV